MKLLKNSKSQRFLVEAPAHYLFIDPQAVVAIMLSEEGDRIAIYLDGAEETIELVGDERDFADLCEALWISES